LAVDQFAPAIALLVTMVHQYGNEQVYEPEHEDGGVVALDEDAGDDGHWPGFAAWAEWHTPLEVDEYRRYGKSASVRPRPARTFRVDSRWRAGRVLTVYERAEFAAQERITVPELALQLEIAAEKEQDLVLHGGVVRNVRYAGVRTRRSNGRAYFFNVAIGPYEEIAFGEPMTASHAWALLHCEFAYL